MSTQLAGHANDCLAVTCQISTAQHLSDYAVWTSNRHFMWVYLILSGYAAWPFTWVYLIFCLGCGITAYRDSKKEPLCLHMWVPCGTRHPRNCAMTAVVSKKLTVRQAFGMCTWPHHEETYKRITKE